MAWISTRTSAWILPIKRLVHAGACHPWIGNCIGAWTNDQLPHRGCVINAAGLGLAPRVKAALYWGIYEKGEVLFVQRYLPSDVDVIELGAGIGVVSAQIAKRMEPSRRLVCVEANPTVLSAIPRNVRRNSSITPEVIHAAICYEDRRSIPLRIAERHLDTRLEVPAANKPSSPPTCEPGIIEVPTVRLRDLVEKLEGRSYALVADIEGAELALGDAESTCLETCRGMILELHASRRASGECVTVDQLASLFEKKHGFRRLARRGDVFAFRK